MNLTQYSGLSGGLEFDSLVAINRTLALWCHGQVEVLVGDGVVVSGKSLSKRYNGRKQRNLPEQVGVLFTQRFVEDEGAATLSDIGDEDIGQGDSFTDKVSASLEVVVEVREMFVGVFFALFDDLLVVANKAVQ